MTDFTQLPTPCYCISESRIEAFSFYALYPLIGSYLNGATASGLYEARLGAEEMARPLEDRGIRCENHIFSPAYREEEFPQIVEYCDHLVFNSWNQVRKFGKRAAEAGRSIGLRVNPECSTQEGHAIYDPCGPGSRLGVTQREFERGLAEPEGRAFLELLEGLHFHTLCEQDSDALEATLDAVEERFGPYLREMKWINFGGGHHITKRGYDIPRLERCIRRMREKYGLTVYLEPGEAVALNAGELVTTVLETGENGVSWAILDASAACHMPDVLEMPYRPPLRNSGKPGEKPYTVLLGGPTCLAGDVIGEYSFDRPLREGERLIFEDMAIYSMVKNNTFNGMPLPAIVLEEKGGNFRIWKEFGYEDFKGRL